MELSHHKVVKWVRPVFESQPAGCLCLCSSRPLVVVKKPHTATRLYELISMGLGPGSFLSRYQCLFG